MPENKTSDIAGQTPEQLLARAYHLNDLNEALDLYRDWAGTYDEAMVDGLGFVAPRVMASRLARHLKNPDGAILDIGCGTGLVGEALSSLGFRVIDGLDISTDMLEQARKRGVYRHLLDADLTKTLPVDTAVYDAGICTGTFTHAHVGAEALDEILRAIRPGGLFACTIHKDVWQPMGFADKLEALKAGGAIREVEVQDGPYYKTSEQPDGKYVLIERL